MTTPISSGPAIKELALRMPPKEAKIPLKKIPGTAKGFADFSLEEQIVFKEWKEIIDNTFALFGFDPLDLPPFVHRKFLLVKGGVEAQIFSVNHLSDNSQTKYGIAFDRTVPFALWIRDNLKKLSFPFKRRDISLSFRAESTRTGRLNGFYQADIDTVGRNLPLTCDAECITVLVSALSQIKSVPSFEVYLNHIEIPKHLIKKAGFTNLEEALRVIDKLDKTPPEQIVAELCQLEPSVSCKEIEQIVSVCSFRGSFKDFQQMSLSLERSSVYIEQVAKVISLVQKAGVNPDLIKFAPGIVRGLNYYTGIVFETFIKDYPQFGSIASGGRYDELVDTFAETKTGIQGVGGSIGLSRLFQVLNFHQAIPKEVKTAAKVLVLMREFELTEKATEVASWLRESKVATQLYLGTLKGIQKQLPYAAKIKVPLAVLVMGERSYVVRDLAAGKQTANLTSKEALCHKVNAMLKHKEKGATIHTRSKEGEIELDPKRVFTIEDFYAIVHQRAPLLLSSSAGKKLDETREFINYLTEKNIRVYGLTTGFGDLRECDVSAEQTALLSHNIILSHNAGIGPMLSAEQVLGAMVLRANSLSKGNSGFQKRSLETLIAMINHRIIPHIPQMGSLGASGDLALLAALGRAMQGSEDALVEYQGKEMTAKDALEAAGISPFVPLAKEGLALTNGTSFMGSGLATAYLKQLQSYENIFALLNLYLNATRSVDAAFNLPVHQVRNQSGQIFVANLLQQSLEGSPFIDRKGIQNDYSQRCLPQIIGPKIAEFLSLSQNVFAELDAVTDNPLIFRGAEVSADVSSERIIKFADKKWCVLSGGNFHGEVIATTAEELSALTAKIAIVLERHLTFVNNPARNKGQFPIYLIHDPSQAGVRSGFMIPQYTANDLTQRICQLAGSFATNFNLTSANESEDVVSYGNSANDKLLNQLSLLQDLTAIYLVQIAQAYSLTREKYLQENGSLEKTLVSERLFEQISQVISLPIKEETGFPQFYAKAKELLATGKLREIIGSPLAKELGIATLPL